MRRPALRLASLRDVTLPARGERLRLRAASHRLRRRDQRRAAGEIGRVISPATGTAHEIRVGRGIGRGRRRRAASIWRSGARRRRVRAERRGRSARAASGSRTPCSARGRGAHPADPIAAVRPQTGGRGFGFVRGDVAGRHRRRIVRRAADRRGNRLRIGTDVETVRTERARAARDSLQAPDSSRWSNRLRRAIHAVEDRPPLGRKRARRGIL